MPLDLLEADFSEPGRIRAVSTTRGGPGADDELDLGRSKAPERLAENRARLSSAIGQPPVQWLRQVHGTRVHHAGRVGDAVEADAVWTDVPGVAIAVTTADCIPVVVAGSACSVVAVIHCGWRGTVDGVIEATLGKLPAEASELKAWLGPGICGRCYEVGTDVYERAAIWANAPRTFTATGAEGKWLFDLPAYVAGRLGSAGVPEVYQSNACTFHEDRFFSYRRDGATGRMATIAWIESR